MRDTIVYRLKSSQFEELLASNKDDMSSGHIRNIISSIAQASLDTHLADNLCHERYEWSRTTEEKKRALAAGIDKIISELQEIKTVFNL